MVPPGSEVAYASESRESLRIRAQGRAESSCFCRAYGHESFLGIFTKTIAFSYSRSQSDNIIGFRADLAANNVSAGIRPVIRRRTRLLRCARKGAVVTRNDASRGLPGCDLSREIRFRDGGNSIRAASCDLGNHLTRQYSGAQFDADERTRDPLSIQERGPSREVRAQRLRRSAQRDCIGAAGGFLRVGAYFDCCAFVRSDPAGGPGSPCVRGHLADEIASAAQGD